MECLAILGSGGHGKVIADIAEQVGWKKIVFFDDNYLNLKKVGEWSVLGGSDDLLKSEFESVIVAIGDGLIRLKKANLLQKHNKKLVSIIHPSAQISRYAKIEAGTVVCENAVIQAFTHIAKACIINSNSTIAHDCQIDEACHISLGATVAGKVTVGRFSWIGNGAAIRQSIQIGDNVLIGSGSVVVKDIPANLTVVGNPARVLYKQVS